MEKEAFKNLLKRYLANSCSEKERLLVEGWYDLIGEEKRLTVENFDDLEDKIWNQVKGKTFSDDKDNEEDRAKIFPLRPWYQRTSWRITSIVAASVLFLMVGNHFWLQPSSTNSISQLDRDQELLASEKTIFNDGQKHKIVWLEDSTKVSLFPNAKLNIPIAFSDDDKREVFLTGEAIFDVTKNPAKPFLVHTGEVVTKVIGTSFKINSKSAKKNVEVEVLSGKVSVYNKDIQKQKKKTNNGVVLTPNQKVTYHAENKQFVTAVVDEPVLIETDRKDTAPQAKLDFIYDETPIELVLAQLEEN